MTFYTDILPWSPRIVDVIRLENTHLSFFTERKTGLFRTSITMKRDLYTFGSNRTGRIAFFLHIFKIGKSTIIVTCRTIQTTSSEENKKKMTKGIKSNRMVPFVFILILW